MTNQLVADMATSKARIKVAFKGNSIQEALSFGFSYIESEDHIVEYVMANSKNLKKVFGEVSDSVLCPDGNSLGDLWTAKLLLSDKLKDNEIFFSNGSMSAIINLNLNSNEEF